MSWSLRLQQMIMAGGVFSFSACGNGHRALGQTIPGTDAGSKEPGVTVPMTPFPVPIGNGSPDPCMFGRAGGSPDAEQICEACWMSYGQWQPATSTAPARCIGGADAAGDAVGDVATGDTAGVTVPPIPNPVPCGNANPDPCICGRAGSSPDAAEICEACWVSGGQWQAATSTPPGACVGGHDASATDASDAGG